MNAHRSSQRPVLVHRQPLAQRQPILPDILVLRAPQADEHRLHVPLPLGLDVRAVQEPGHADVGGQVWVLLKRREEEVAPAHGDAHPHRVPAPQLGEAPAADGGLEEGAIGDVHVEACEPGEAVLGRRDGGGWGEVQRDTSVERRRLRWSLLVAGSRIWVCASGGGLRNKPYFSSETRKARAGVLTLPGIVADRTDAGGFGCAFAF